MSFGELVKRKHLRSRTQKNMKEIVLWEDLIYLKLVLQCKDWQVFEVSRLGSTREVDGAESRITSKARREKALKFQKKVPSFLFFCLGVCRQAEVSPGHRQGHKNTERVFSTSSELKWTSEVGKRLLCIEVLRRALLIAAEKTLDGDISIEDLKERHLCSQSSSETKAIRKREDQILVFQGWEIRQRIRGFY